MYVRSSIARWLWRWSSVWKTCVVLTVNYYSPGSYEGRRKFFLKQSSRRVWPSTRFLNGHQPRGRKYSLLFISGHDAWYYNVPVLHVKTTFPRPRNKGGSSIVHAAAKVKGHTCLFSNADAFIGTGTAWRVTAYVLTFCRNDWRYFGSILAPISHCHFNFAANSI